MSTTKKQLGDRVLITAGPCKDKIGKLVSKERRGWIVELDDGEKVSVSFPMIAVVRSINEQGGESTEEQSVDVTSVEESNVETSVETPESNSGNETETSEQDITKMTVKELQAIAKQRKIGIARTKSDFLRIIQEKNPDEDLDQLTGKTLFNRISELHISRLRTKQDLIRLLTADESR